MDDMDNQKTPSSKKRFIPNAITLMNFALGFFSLFLTMEGLFREAAYAIFGAMAMDGLDGRLARRFNTVSEFGKELDSLSDLVSFGVAPALLAYTVNLFHFGRVGQIIAMVFALCGAFRLARFNVLNVETHFVGVPITICGPVLTFVLLFSNSIDYRIYPVVVLLLWFLMVCSWRIPKV